MGCGCKNCNGTVSQNSQLPPGCDSILSITTDNIGEETIVTITFCSGDTQQFSIPSGVDGSSGPAGADGADGADGVDGVQGETGIVGQSAYVIDHVGLDVSNEDNIAPVLTSGGAAKVLARSLLPANTWPSAEDTVYFDILINLEFGETLAESSEEVFKLLTLQLNPSLESDTTSGISLWLEGPVSKLRFPECTLKFSGEITRRNYTDEVANQSYTALDLIVKGESFGRRSTPVDNITTGYIGAVSTSAKGTQNLSWAVQNTAVNQNVDNYLKIVGDPAGFQTTGGPQLSVTSTQIYFTTKYLPRNES